MEIYASQLALFLFQELPSPSLEVEEQRMLLVRVIYILKGFLQQISCRANGVLSTWEAPHLRCKLRSIVITESLKCGEKFYAQLIADPFCARDNLCQDEERSCSNSNCNKVTMKNLVFWHLKHP